MEARGLGLRRYNGRREIGASFRCALPPERMRPSGLELYAFPQQLLGSRLFFAGDESLSLAEKVSVT